MARERTGLSKAYVFVSLILLYTFWTARSHVLVNLEVVDVLVTPYTTDEPLSSIDDVWLFFHISFTLFALSIVFFVRQAKSLMSRISRAKNTVTSLWMVIFSVIILCSIGYCTQVSLIDPINDMCRYGNPCFHFSFVSTLDGSALEILNKIRTNPFLYPALTIGLFSLFLPLLYELSRQMKKTTTFKKSRFFGWLFIVGTTFFVMMILGMLSSFRGGLTLIEIPKNLIFFAFAGAFLQTFQYWKRLKKYKLHIVVIFIFFLLPFIALLFIGDSGALLIITFSAFLIVVGGMAHVYLPLWGGLGYLFLWVVQDTVSLGWIDARFQDWQLTDIFMTSGLGTSNIADTASSPDIARSYWGIASGGWFGRDSALFVDDADGVYTSTLSYGYNDRISAILIESYGFVGMMLVLATFLVLLVSLLKLFDISRNNKLPTSGLVLGFAALLFGQVMVHIGGNFNFIPFTGIVLPFLSHGGMSFMSYMLVLCILIAMYAAEPGVTSPKRKSKEFRAERSQLPGMTFYIILSFGLLLIHTFMVTILKGSDISTRIRYDVQADLSIKTQRNPRLYLLMHQMNATGEIRDSQNEMVRDSTGNYQMEYFDGRDYFLHQFEEEHKLILEGFTTEQYGTGEYFSQNCQLPDGDYYQFAGVTKTNAVANQLNYFERRGYSDNPLEDGLPRYCIVSNAQQGRFFTADKVGRPADPSNISEGCILEDGETVLPEKLKQVLFYDAEQADVWNVHQQDPTAPKPEPIAYPDSSLWGSVFASQPLALSCVVRALHTAIEERSGTQTAEGCMVQDKTYDEKATTLYTAMDLSIQTGKNKFLLFDDVIKRSLDELSTISSMSITEGENDACSVSIERIACEVDGTLYAVQQDMSIEDAVARIDISFGRNRSLEITDDVCTVSIDQMGDIRMKGEGFSSPVLFGRNKYSVAPTDTDISLHRFMKSSLSKQVQIRDQIATHLQDQKVMINLNGALQAKVRAILLDNLEKFSAPTIQALVFDVNTGEILSQAQASTIRQQRSNYYQRMYDEGRYRHLYSDRGEYGYGKDLLYSKYTPASIFKLYNALAAVDAGLTDVTHTCTRTGYLPPEPDDSWRDPRTKKFKPITCYPDNTGRPSRHGKMTFEKAITKSCNQYFARLAIEGDEERSTHPENLTRMCQEEGLHFGWSHKARDGSDLQCALASPGTYSAGLNGYGQSLVMDVYQVAALLQVVSSNKSPSIDRSAYVQDIGNEKTPLLDSLSLLNGDEVEKILRAMQAHNNARKITENLNAEDGLSDTDHIRVYGKTGTGDRLLSEKEHHRPKKGDYIEERTKRNGETVWVENLEEPYGVTGASNVALFVSLVEKAENPAAQVGTNRIGVVVRVPRSIHPDGWRVSGGSVASPISQEIIKAIRDLELLDSPSEE